MLGALVVCSVFLLNYEGKKNTKEGMLESEIYVQQIILILINQFLPRSEASPFKNRHHMIPLIEDGNMV